jgi:hypothetical protein
MGHPAQTLKCTHGRYASYWNARQSSSGHVWQGRFYSCPLDDSHLWEALRYTELNPVRAGMVQAAEQRRWSSASAHCGTAGPDAMLAIEPWQKRWTVSEWRDYLAAGETPTALTALRQCTHTGRPALRNPQPIPATPLSPLWLSLIKLGNVPSVPGFSVCPWVFDCCRRVVRNGVISVCPRIPQSTAIPG